MDPWGTPFMIVMGLEWEVIVGPSETVDLISTTWVRSERYELSQFRAGPCIPKDWSLVRRILWLMVSKALLRS